MTAFTISDFRRAMVDGAYAWPGGYPRYFVMDDGEALSFAAAKANRRAILESTAGRINDGWCIAGVDINWEDASLYCAHTGERIPAAYCED